MEKFGFTGIQVDAEYQESEDPMYRHNAFIEALPPILSSEDVAIQMRRHPAYREIERGYSAEYRLQAVQRISNFMEPLPVHLDLEQRFSRMIRNGYMARNPISPEWKKQLRSAFPDLIAGKTQPVIRSTASGFSIIGTSGVGKSTAVESVLSLYPQVISHTSYNGNPFNQRQLVWLKLECPYNGKPRGLCLNFFQMVDAVLGTNYYKNFLNSKMDATQILPRMAGLASSLGLGVLVIDEIQRLIDGEGKAQEMMNFFVELINTIGVPVVIVGTFKALHLISREFSQIRRSAGQGDFVWGNFAHDEIWDFFLENLWQYQWTQKEVALTEELSETLYEESQGIPDIAVKLYMITQWQAIGESEKISSSLIREVAKENLKLAKPILDALKARDYETLSQISDMYPPIRNLDNFFNKAKERVTVEGALNTLRNQQKAASHNDSSDQSMLFEVAQWLVDAGIDVKLARECAQKAIDRNGQGFDLTKVKQDAIAFALKLNLDHPAEEKPSAKRPKKNPKIDDSKFPGDLRGVLKESKEEGKNPYDALKESGLIQSDQDIFAI